MDDLSSPILPKGRGAWISAIINSREAECSKAVPDGYADTGLGQSPSYTPTSVPMGGGGGGAHILPPLAVILMPFIISQTW